MTVIQTVLGTQRKVLKKHRKKTGGNKNNKNRDHPVKDIVNNVFDWMISILFRSARILRRVLQTCSHSLSNERQPAKAGVKNSYKVNNFLYYCAFYDYHLFIFFISVSLIILFPNPSAREGYDTRSIFKRILAGLNSEFSFS